MNRREFISTAVASVQYRLAGPLIVPVRQVSDTRANCTPEQVRGFSSSIWPEAVRDFRRCGIEVQTRVETGEIGRSPGGLPVFKGLERGVINVVVTDRVPMAWDHGRGLNGVSTRHEGYHLCMIALDYAHAHQIPFFSVNTCVHELLHVLFQDIFVRRPEGLRLATHELRIDWHATRLWLFHDGAGIRRAAGAYLERLRSSVAARA